MKFGHVWCDEVKSIPESLRDICLSYKKYKKIKVGREGILEELQKDVRRVDKVFRWLVNGGMRGNILGCRCDFLKVDVGDIIKFADLNAVCLRKICKRLDKRLGGGGVFTGWWREGLREFQWLFANGKVIKSMKLKMGGEGSVVECPVCLEEVAKGGERFVMHCGHVVCRECAVDMVGAHGLRGTLANVIAYGLYEKKGVTTCPLCRDAMAFRDWEVV